MFLALLLFVANACNREGDVLSTEESSQGIYLRTIADNSTAFSQTTFSSSKIDLNLELAGASAQNNLQEVRVYLDYEDSDLVYNAPEKLVATYTLADFALSATSQLYRKNITFTAAQMFQLLGITNQTIYGGGDYFTVRFAAVAKDGKVYTNSNLGADLTGEYYKSPFMYRFNVVCPYNLAPFSGSYSVVADDWADYAAGDVLSVVAGPNANQIRIPSTSNPYLVNTSSSMILTIDNAGNVVVTADQIFDYGGGFTVAVTGKGKVNFCNGGIDLLVNFGSNTNQIFTLKKL